jgi:hypothetical protein
VGGRSLAASDGDGEGEMDDRGLEDTAADRGVDSCVCHFACMRKGIINASILFLGYSPLSI